MTMAPMHCASDRSTIDTLRVMALRSWCAIGRQTVGKVASAIGVEELDVLTKNLREHVLTEAIDESLACNGEQGGTGEGSQCTGDREH